MKDTHNIHMKQVLTLAVLIANALGVFAQTSATSENNKGHFAFSISFQALPVNRKASAIDFLYSDGKPPSGIPIDTVKASYTLQNHYVSASVGLGLTYYLFKNIVLSLQAKPHLNSFASNTRKNGKVYGVQFDFLGTYEGKIRPEFGLTAGLGMSRIIGGYGITSGGASKKEYLLVNGNELYDPDIGFHIVDHAWLVGCLFSWGSR